MQLNTPRLLLTSIGLGDLPNVHQLHSLKESDEFNTLGVPGNIEETEIILNSWIESKTSYVFSLTEKESKDFAGLIALILGKPKYQVAEVWYKTLPSFWGKGYTSEALQAVLTFAFRSLQLHRVEAGCATSNTRSIRVLEKAGMKLEGTKRKVLPIRGEWIDSFSYAMLETEFETRSNLPVKEDQSL